MPQVNLTNVSGQELRQLLDSSRRRGDAALSYRILQEMAARRETPAERRAFKGRRPAEPRVVAVEFGDPLDKTEDLPPMPNWRPPSHQTVTETEMEASPPPESALAAASPQPRRSRRAPRPDRALAMAAAASASFAAEDDAPPPSRPLDADRPLSLRDHDPEPIEDEADDPPPLRSGFQPIELGVPKKPPKSRGRLLAGAVLGVILGAAVGWLGGWLARDGMSRPSRPATAPVQTAALAPLPAPLQAPAAAEPAPDAAPGAALGPSDAQPAPQASAPPASPPPKAQEPAPVPDGTAMELPAPGAEEAEADAAKAAKAERAAKAAERARAARERAALAQAAPEALPVAVKGCATQPTPADRTICGDARLRRLQADLRRAYDEALAAHEDRALLREHQLAWRDTRSAVADPDRLARLYEARIRKLNAATAEARRAQQ
jgi:chemotaxis protein histidine kinase CheA